ncbi:hypothetical protein CFC21_099106 [Triticum aestivum]|uniref:Uncharacterized protein n=2 Tax=Triticum aestivum TaxID=4565 RepID=A0A9R1LY98_WHEAT|nr:hypothetical protein CFC21_099106 [Triticum aestivum]
MAAVAGWFKVLMMDVVVGGGVVKRVVKMDGAPTTPAWPWRRPEVEKEAGGEGDVASPFFFLFFVLLATSPDLEAYSAFAHFSAKETQ